jgi:wyosine [tRNA(Phe)-imidazoG37] synthetase (radical SAM superfamily)
VDVVERKARSLCQQEETIDYLTFVADGEPTLDIDLGRAIRELRSSDVRIAVITNASLMDRVDVRADLLCADLVSLKIDAVDEDTWRKINRPHGKLDLDGILRGMKRFSSRFRGRLITETMLVQGLNDSDKHLRDLGDFLSLLRPATAYLAIPIRPPAEASVHPPSEAVVNRAYQLVSERFELLELLLGYEGNEFASTGDATSDLLSITAVHPMREDAVRALLDRTGEDWTVVRDLVSRDELVETRYRDDNFFMRNLVGHGPHFARPELRGERSP